MATIEEEAANIKAELKSALTVVNAIVRKASDKGFNISYKSDMLDNKEFLIKIDVSKRL